METFTISTDPEFVAMLRDIVGLHVDAPKRAVVFSVDEKRQIQAPSRTPPGLPMKKGRAGTMTHDNERHGTTPPSPRSTSRRTAASMRVIPGTAATSVSTS